MSEWHWVPKPQENKHGEPFTVTDPQGNEWHGFHTYYPQMGGYASYCTVLHDGRKPDVPDMEGTVDACFRVLVWHDGEFPFRLDGGNPRELHHCMASQFIEFGEDVLRFQKELASSCD